MDPKMGQQAFFHAPHGGADFLGIRQSRSGVTEIVGGAHPSSMPPAYGWDMKAFKAYADAAKDPGDWAAVRDRFVGASEESYLAGFGGKEGVAALPLPIF